MSKNKHIQAVEASQLRDDIPDFAPGDTVTVDVRVVEGSRERIPVSYTHLTLPTKA